MILSSVESQMVVEVLIEIAWVVIEDKMI